MKKLNFEFIKKVDFLLFFILAVLGIVLCSVIIIQQFLPPNRYPGDEQIPVVEKDDVEIKEYIGFSQKIKDAYVFYVKSSGIKNSENFTQEERKDVAYYSSAKRKYRNDDAITNFIFVKNNEKKEEYSLFSSNVFIYKYRFFCEKKDAPYSTYVDCNIYAVVKEDTNKDKILNADDDIVLYVSSYDGKGLKEISSSVVKFEFTAENEFLFAEYDGSDLLYYTYNCKQNLKTLIKSVKQKEEIKTIALY
ncbi:MAG: hypothetical protein ACTTHG_08040 [Treponemataceae bacterium]